MKLSTVIGLAAATAVFTGATMLVNWSGTDDPVVERAGEPVFPDLEERLDDVQRITLTNNVRTLTIHRDEGTWRLKEFADYPARQARVRELLIGLADLEYYEPKTSRPDLYERLELNDVTDDRSRVRHITLYGADDQELLDVYAGKNRFNLPGAQNKGIYLRFPGKEQTWLTRGSFVPVEDPMRWIDQSIIDLPSTTWQRVTLLSPAGEKIVFTKEDPDSTDYKVANPPEGKSAEGGWSVNVVGSVLTGLDLEDVKRAEEVDFENNEVWRATYESYDGLTVNIRMADIRTDYWAVFDASAGENASENAVKLASDINDETAGWAYRLVSYKATPLRTRMDELIAESGAEGSPGR